MAKPDKANKIDMTKSQLKGSKARIKRKLTLDTSLLHSREYRKAFGTFSENKQRRQKPVWLKVEGKNISMENGIQFELILPKEDTSKVVVKK